MIRPLTVLALILTTLALAGCHSDQKSQAPGPIAMDAAALESWEIALVEARIEKNEQFTTAPDSPLPPDLKQGFEGLDYYFPAQDLRYRALLVAAAGTDTVILDKRKGAKVPYLRKGTVSFEHDGKSYTLSVFGPTEGDDYLWLPFYDATNGDTTYQGGRYLDLTQAADGTVELDFNRAYNPLCAYNPDAYNCTLPPPENRLSFPVDAGEKLLAAAAH